MTTTYGTLSYQAKPALAVVGPPRRQPRASWSITAQPHVMIRLKRVFPRVDVTRVGAVTLADTAETAREIAWFCDRFPLAMDRDVAARLRARAAEYEQRRSAIDDLFGAADRLTFDTEPSRPPRDYQLECAAMVRTMKRVLIADDAGLGKTYEALLTLAEPDALPALVVTLTSLPTQWVRELGDTWPWLVGHAVTSARPYDLTNLRGHRGHAPDVLVMGYSKLAGWSDALAGKIKTLILDEAHELRNGTDTAKGMGAAQIADQANYVIPLTASPVQNYGDDIHNMISVWAPDALGTRSEFLREWGGGTATGGRTMVKDPAALGAYLRAEGLMLRRTRADVKRELPDPVRIRQQVESDPAKLAELSEDVLAIARLILDDATSNTDRFKAAGDLDWRLRQATGIAKAVYVAAFVKLLLESEEKVLLYGWHRAVYDIWMEQLAGYRPVMFTGSESRTQKQHAVDAFTDGDARVLVMSLASGAGLDGLQKVCSATVFGELDWSPGVHDQAIWRIDRDGQASTVAAYFLVSDSGSDPVVEEVLQLKSMQAGPIVNPGAPLVAPASPDMDRARRLARAIIDQAAAA